MTKNLNQAFTNDRITNGVGDGEEGHIDTMKPDHCSVDWDQLSSVWTWNSGNLGTQQQMMVKSSNNQFAYYEKHKVLYHCYIY